MIIIVCQDINEDTGWGTYTNQYSKILDSFDEIVIICNKKNKKLKIKQYDILHKANEYLSNPFKIILDVYKINIILKTLNAKSKLHITVEPYALLVPFIKNNVEKIFLTLHGSYFFKLQRNFISSFFFKKAIKSISKIVYVSNYTKKKINKKLQKITNIKTEIITNGINSVKRKPKNSINHSLNILCLSAIKFRKGQINLVKSINLLNKKYQNFKVIFAGEVHEPNYLELIKLEINKMKTQNKFSFMGHVNERKKKELFKKSDLFVLLSEDTNDDFEGYGLVYLEALSYGLPIIVSNQSGCSEFNFKHNSGLIVNPHDYKKISNFIYLITKSNISKASKQCIQLCAKENWKNKTSEIKNFYI
mgnify:CR=1 FL=1